MKKICKAIVMKNNKWIMEQDRKNKVQWMNEKIQ